MNNVGINTSVHANVVAPFSPVGKQAVGLENAEAKEEVFPPTEEPATAEAVANRKPEANDSEQTSRNRNEERISDRQEQQQQIEDQQLIRELSARDREVRAHEQAHGAVGGQYAGAPSYTYERGPDGVNYAVGGEVPIALPNGGGDPEQTLAAAEQVRRAALAPAEPSAQDRRVAAAAAQVAAEARADIVEQQTQERRVKAEQAELAREEERQRELQEQEEKEQLQREEEAHEQRLKELQQSARRSVQLGEQLITLNNVQSDQNLGSFLDQHA